MAGPNGAQKIMEHVHSQPGNWSCWGLTVWFMVSLTESGFLMIIETGFWGGLGVGEPVFESERCRRMVLRTLGGTLCQLEAEQTALDIPALLQGRGADSTGCPGMAQERIHQLEGLQRKWMSLKFWSIKVILYPATEAVGQWKQITVHSPNRKIKTQEAAECCRHWPWLHNPANLCCLWGCTAVSEKTNLLVQRLLFSIIFLSFFFPDTNLCL